MYFNGYMGIVSLYIAKSTYECAQCVEKVPGNPKIYTLYAFGSRLVWEKAELKSKMVPKNFQPFYQMIKRPTVTDSRLLGKYHRHRCHKHRGYMRGRGTNARRLDNGFPELFGDVLIVADNVSIFPAFWPFPVKLRKSLFSPNYSFFDLLSSFLHSFG